MNRLTSGIRQALLRKEFSWMDGEYRFLLMDDRYEYVDGDITVEDLALAYVIGQTETFLPTSDNLGIAISNGVNAVSVVSDYDVTTLLLVEHSGDEVVDRVVAVIDEGYGLPFASEGQDITITPNTLYNNGWFVV